jgi:hypothetical protein
MPKKYVRPRGGVILRHPETGSPYVPADELIDESDPLVKAHRWAFVSDEEAAEEAAAARQVESVVVESATKRPGQKRNTGRSKA